MNSLFNEIPHRRFNPLSNEWVMVSPHRTKRPWQGKNEEEFIEKKQSYDPNCYLCPGNVRAGGKRNEKYHSTYSFTNDFSALLPQIDAIKEEDEIFRIKSEKGECRVICFSPDHSKTIAEMTVSEIEKIIKVWQSEYSDLSKKDFINYVQIFENKGEIMGCSNPHPHGQIWASESIPGEVLKEQNSQLEYYKKYKKTLLGDYVFKEIAKKERIIFENKHFVLLVPFWAVWPYETMIISKRPFRRITELNCIEVKSFAEIISVNCIKFDNLFQTSFPYSSGIHQAPTDANEHPEWHFHMHFYPPLLRSASIKKFMVGFEMLGNPQRDLTAEYSAGVLRALPDVHYKLNT